MLSPPRLIGIGTALPPFEITQGEALDFLLSHFPLRDGMRELCRRVFAHESVRTRRLAVSRLADLLDTDLDRKNARFEREAVGLSAAALRRALKASGLRPRDLDYLAAATCTGYLCPGLAPQVAEAAGLRPDIAYADLVGMGCGGALPALRAADLFARAHPGAAAAVVCAEVCSAAFLMKDAADLAISNALFGDGAAAAILGPGRRGPAFTDWASWLVPAWREDLRFRTDGGHLRNVLSTRVPEKAGEATSRVLGALMRERGLARRDIRRWVLHAGGAKVLEALEGSLSLSRPDLASAWSVLRRVGNLSSASVLFVLQDSLKRRPPRKGERGFMASFGAGFSCFGALLSWD